MNVLVFNPGSNSLKAGIGACQHIKIFESAIFRFRRAQLVAHRKATRGPEVASTPSMIRKLKSGQFRLYSRKKDESTGMRKNLGTFSTLEQAKQHEREVQYFKRH